MSHCDTNLCICVKSELDIFSLPPTQTSIEDGIVVDYHPIASLVDTGPIEFDIPVSVEHYLDLAHVYLHLAVKIERATLHVKKVTVAHAVAWHMRKHWNTEMPSILSNG